MSDAFKPGMVLFKRELPPAGRARVAAFSVGTEDPNPIHVDDEFAHKAGFSTVLQQGPMTTSHFARLLEERVGRGKLRILDITFTAPVYPDDSLTLVAEVAEAGNVVKCNLSAFKGDGSQTAKGTAEIIL
jgi:acyl dehydratase